MKIRIRLKSCNGGYVLANWSISYRGTSEEWHMAVMFLAKYQQKLRDTQLVSIEKQLFKRKLMELDPLKSVHPSKDFYRDSWKKQALELYPE